MHLFTEAILTKKVRYQILNLVSAKVHAQIRKALKVDEPVCLTEIMLTVIVAYSSPGRRGRNLLRLLCRHIFSTDANWQDCEIKQTSGGALRTNNFDFGMSSYEPILK